VLCLLRCVRRGPLVGSRLFSNSRCRQPLLNGQLTGAGHVKDRHPAVRPDQVSCVPSLRTSAHPVM
jgi:hypothetical protein